MLFALLDQFKVDPVGALLTMVVFSASLVVAITVHEFSHALSATLLGDTTAKNQGRLTLSPAAHLDPVGTTMIVVAGFGWGRPTPFDPDRLSAGPRSGTALVAIAGPISNLAVAFLAALPMNAGLVHADFIGRFFAPNDFGDLLPYLLGSLVLWNLLLAAFNLIPLAPLDGFKVAIGILPEELAARFAQLERYGPMVLLGAIMLDIMLPGPGILSAVIWPMVRFLTDLVLGGQL